MKTYTQEEFDKGQRIAINLTAEKFKEEFKHLIWSNFELTLFVIFSLIIGITIGLLLAK